MSVPGRIFRILSGYEIAVVCLSLLFVLTFFGTIEQQWSGLWSTIHKYFDYRSVFVWPTRADGKAIFLPLPGAYWVIVVLAVNMFMGGIVRARKGWKKAGVLLSHFAILFMLVAGGVSSLYKEEGNMRVTEGQKSDYAVKLFKHDIEVFRYDENGDREPPAIIRSEHLKELGKEDQLEVTFEKFDFKLTVDQYLPYTNLAIDSPRNPAPKGAKVVDGFYLAEVEKDVEQEERNTPGCYVTIRDQNDEPIQELVLWGMNPRPVTFTHEGARYGVMYWLEIWPMPFEIELAETFGENHPNTSIPRWYQSNITKVSDSGREDYKIVMNEPARHGGYTLYQSGFTPALPGETASSTFAVVNNPADKWPEYALYASALGLTFHFLFMLVRFAWKGHSAKPEPTPVPQTS
jgi:hypothetical protein